MSGNLVQLVHKALEDPGLFGYGELLELPEIMEVRSKKMSKPPPNCGQASQLEHRPFLPALAASEESGD